jgi:Zn-dependent protease
MKKDLVLTSLAGPASNLLLAIASAILFFVMWTIAGLLGAGSDNFVVGILDNLFYMLYFYNIILAVFNLLPVPPLDGFKIFGALLPNNIYYKLMNYERYIGMAFLLLILFGRGILSSILEVISWPFKAAIWVPLQMLFTLLWKALGI